MGGGEVNRFTSETAEFLVAFATQAEALVFGWAFFWQEKSSRFLSLTFVALLFFWGVWGGGQQA